MVDPATRRIRVASSCQDARGGAAAARGESDAFAARSRNVRYTLAVLKRSP